MSIITVTYWGLQIPNEKLGLGRSADVTDLEDAVHKLSQETDHLSWDVSSGDAGYDACGALLVAGTMSFFDDHGIWKIPKKPINLDGLRELEELAEKFGLTGEDGPGWLVSVDPS